VEWSLRTEREKYRVFFNEMYKIRGTGPSRFTANHDQGCCCHFCRNQAYVRGTLGKRLRTNGGALPSEGAQLKYVDWSGISTIFQAVSNPPLDFSQFPGPSEGAAQYNRVRSKILNKYLWIRGYIKYGGGGDYQPTVLRHMIVYDRQPNNIQQVYSDVIQSVNSAGSSTNGVTSPLNVDNLERFEILLDEQIYIGQASDPPTPVSGAEDKSKYSIDRVISLEGLTTQFIDSSGTDVSSGQIMSIWVCEGGIGDPANVAWIGTMRLCYQDS